MSTNFQEPTCGTKRKREPIIIPQVIREIMGHANISDNIFCSDSLAGLRFRIFHALRVHGDLLHDLRGQRSVVVIGIRLSNLIHHIHAFDDLSECRVTAVQMGCIFVHDEEVWGWETA